MSDIEWVVCDTRPEPHGLLSPSPCVNPRPAHPHDPVMYAGALPEPPSHQATGEAQKRASDLFKKSLTECTHPLARYMTQATPCFWCATEALIAADAAGFARGMAK